MTEATAPTTPVGTGSKSHKALLVPAIQGAIGIEAWGKFLGAVDVVELVGELGVEIQKVAGGDMRPVEAMLYGQAVTLQTIFTNLAIRAERQENVRPFQALLTLALKAQSQCRATIEALAEIKNPRPVAFVRQANIAHQQQVNNGATPETIECSRGDEKRIPQNELLEAPHVDSRAQNPAVGAHPHLEAVGARDRASDSRR